MSVKLSIELEALGDPAVARALAELMAALGTAAPAGVTLPPVSLATAPTAPAPTAPAPAAPVIAAPAAVVAPAAVAAPAAPAAVTVPAAPLAATPPPATSVAPPPAAPIPVGAPGFNVAQAYIEFVEGLAEKPRRFLELLRTRGRLRIDEAMAELEIDQPKAVGGITGAIGRWAPARGVPVPYTAVQLDGKRAWRWTGVPGLDDRPIDPTSRPQAAPAPTRAPAPAAAAPAPAAPAPKPARPAPKAAQAGDANTRFVRFITELPEEAQHFLRLVYERKELTMPEALEHFGLNRPKAMGKMTEPITRLSQEWGLPMPYDSTRHAAGYRVWNWRGFDEA